MSDNLPRRSDTGPFVVVPLWVADAVSPNALRLYIELSRFADNETGECWPSNSRLTEGLGKSVESIRRHQNELAKTGALTVIEQYRDDGSRTHNRYMVHRCYPDLTSAGGPAQIRADGLLTSEDTPCSEVGRQEELDSVELDPRELEKEPPSSSERVDASQVEVLDDATRKREWDGGFEVAWEHYPRKIAKQKARKAWIARRRQGVPASEMAQAVLWYAAVCRKKRIESEFIMHGATFFGPGERWRDYAPDGEALREMEADPKLRGIGEAADNAARRAQRGEDPLGGGEGGWDEDAF